MIALSICFTGYVRQAIEGDSSRVDNSPKGAAAPLMNVAIPVAWPSVRESATGHHVQT